MLTDVLDRITEYLPRYFMSVGTILAHPVEEVWGRARHPELFRDALVFWLIGQVIDNVVRYLAHFGAVDETRYLLTNLISSAASLVIVAGAFHVAWRLVGARTPFAAMITGIAYLWGALAPLSAISVVLATGFLRIYSPEGYEFYRQAMLGCAGFGELLSDPEPLGPGAAPMAALSFALVVSIEMTVASVYFLAFLRVVRRLGGVGAGRFVPGIVLSVLALAAAAGLSSLYHQTFTQGLGACATGT